MTTRIIEDNPTREWAQSTGLATADQLPVGVGVIRLDEELSIAYANPTFRSLFGMREAWEAEVSDNLLGYISEDSVSQLVSLLHHTAATATRASINVCTGHNLSRWVRITAREADTSLGIIEVFCTAEEADEYIHLESALELERQRMDLVSRFAKQIIYELDVEQRLVRHFGHWAVRLGPLVSADGYAESLFRLDFLHEDSVAVVQEVIDNAGESGEVSIAGLWCRFCHDEFRSARILGRPILDANGRVIRMIGCFFPADADEPGGRRVIDTALIDPLTGLYGKSASERIIAEWIKAEPLQPHALILFQIDHLRQLNESRGHMYGDMVLKDISKLIRSCLREGDLLGRYSGASLIAFCPNLGSLETAQELAASVCGRVRENYSERRTGLLLDCVVGVASFSGRGDNVDELFRRADIDLNQALGQLDKPYTII